MPIKIKKYIAFFLLFFVIGGFVVGAMPTPAKAQWATIDIPTIGRSIWEILKTSYEKITKQLLATAFKKSLSTFLNKLAYDSAVYVAAGGSGQKSLINPFSREALSNLGDAVAGGFIDELAQKSGFTGTPGQPGALGTTSLCEPVNLTVKANLLLSFKTPKEPPVPKCSLTKIKQAAQKTANDNLLEITAGAREGETDIISRSINQAMGNVPVKNDLLNISEILDSNIKSYTSIAKAIINQHEDQRQAVADQSAEPLKNNESNISSALNQLNDIINNRGPKCSAAIDKSIAAGCFSSECADFGSVITCKETLNQSIIFAANLVAEAAPALEDIKQFNRSISARAFAPPTVVDVKDLANAFNPEANELGTHQKIQEALGQNVQKALEVEKLKQLASGPCKGVESTVTGEVKTPASVPCKTLETALEKSSKPQETLTGTVADAVGIFMNTLTAKLMERYFKQGLSMIIDRKGVKGGDKTEDVLRSGASLSGKTTAEKALGGLLTASIESGGQQDILSILAACPPEQPALNNCIIDEPFRRAIEKQLTVKEAMEAYKKSGGSEGLDPKKPFGYILVGTAMDEPDFKNGYPYRSMLYLRKYRIIPVGWELAAQYIKDIEAVKQVHTLENVADGFDDPISPFFGLADPAWVLKSPQVFCARQGPGPELLSSEMQCEKFTDTGQCAGDEYQSRKVSRKEWCADEQTCLEEGENGDCKRYGYCTLEKQSWKLGATQCDKPYASCEGYTNSVTKANYTILENTLNKSDCSQSNVGCQWYCQDAPKMCVGGTRSGQPCGINNDCSTTYCSLGTCVDSGLTCSYDTDCGSGATGFCSNNNLISCTTATVDTDCGAGNNCILCDTGSRACVNGDTPGIACTTNAQCGRGVVDGVCEEGGVWSCKAENLVADGNMEASDLSAWNTTGGCNASTDSKSTVAHSGSQSMYIAYDNLNPVCQGRGQSANLIVGKTYTLEAWVKTNGGPSNGYIYNPWPTATQWYSVDSLSEWQHISYTFVATNTSFQFGFRIRDNGTSANGVYVDDVRLYEGDRVNLDRDVKKCEAKDAGCNQFIKVLPGTNLIGNSGFEEDADAQFSPSLGMSSGGYINRWYIRNNSIIETLDARIDTTTVHSGKNSLYIDAESNADSSSANGLYMGDITVTSPTPSVVPLGFRLDPAKTYTASAWIYVVSPSTSTVALSFGHAALGRWEKFVTNQPSSQWERISIAITPDIMLPGNDFNADGIPDTAPNEIRIHLDSGNSGFYIDDLQLEEGDTTSNYAQYGASNQAYLNGRRLSCLKQEVGCNLYTPADGGEPIPAVVKTKDQCPAECAGYASFHQLPSFFEPSSDPVNDYPNLIPSTAISCQASSVGCEEFTNLDTVASGGEAKEYYTKLRQCAKPGTTTEATFYTWEGSEEAGFQLRAWRFKSADHDSNTATPMRPYVTDNDYDCAEASDPDCRTFYDQSGNTFTEEISSTVFISNECHPLRKTIQGTRQDCNDSGGRAEPAGAVMTDIVTCFYDAIPSQGIKCAPKYAGCREYRGAAGNNLRVALNDDFEDLTSQGWTPSSLSSESLTVGGRSYYLFTDIVPDPNNYTLGKNVADVVTEGKTYVLEFWAKWNKNEPDPPVPGQPISSWRINARFQAPGFSGPAFPLGTDIGNSGEWNKYAVGPVVFDREVSPSETLMIFPADGSGVLCEPEPSAPSSPCAGNFYLDNIVLREITDNPYLIKDSWETPLSCDLDPADSGRVVDSIDNPPAGITALDVAPIKLDDSAGFPDPDGLDNILIAIDGEIIQYTNVNGNILENITRGMRGTTPAAHGDNAEVWLLDEGAQLGCKEYADRLGQKTYLRSFDYLCSEDRVGCTEMFNTHNSRSMYDQTTKGEYVPRDSVEYIVDNPKVYCDSSFKGCEKLGQPALGPDQSISSWGETYLINDPDQYETIACESSENMCSEFVTRNGGTAYFKDPKDALCEYHSTINIEGIITKGWFKKGIIPAALGDLEFYDSDGNGSPDTRAHPECATAAGYWNETKWTYSCPNDQVGCTEFQNPVVNALPNSNNASYALEQGVDSASCTGVIDPEIGCVPFYDSSNPILNIDSSIISGNAFAPAACFKCSLVKNSENTSVGCIPANGDICSCDNSVNGTPLTDYCDANAILKVRADRQCAEWLACRESERTTDSKGNAIEMCKTRQACRIAGDGVECDAAAGGWIVESTQNQTFDNPVLVDAHDGDIAAANLRSGLFKAGAHWSKMCSGNTALNCLVDQNCIDQGAGLCVARADVIEGYYPYAQMPQTGIAPIAFEDDFETYQSNVALPQCSANSVACPADTVAPGDGCEEAKQGICLNYWQLGSPKATNKEFKFGGQSLLVAEPTNVGAASAIVSKPIPVTPGETYALTVWINTKDLQGANSALNPDRLVVDVVDEAGINSTTIGATYARQDELKPWTKYIVPFAAPAANIRIRVYLANICSNDSTMMCLIDANCGVGNTCNLIKAGSKAYVDMISLAPVLMIQANPISLLSLSPNYNTTFPDNISNPLPAAFTDRSCRVYAKPDALTCKYRERNTGREIQGWRGFCAEADPKNPEYCLQWWPIDLISGEDISKF